MPQGTQLPSITQTSTIDSGKPTIASLSHEYYNLIVFTDDDFELPIHTAWASVSRSPYNQENWIPDEIKKSGRSADRIIKKELLKIPAVICYENTYYHCNLNPWNPVVKKCLKPTWNQGFQAFFIYDFPHLFGANSSSETLAKKTVFISLSALFCNLNFTDSGAKQVRHAKQPWRI